MSAQTELSFSSLWLERKSRKDGAEHQAAFSLTHSLASILLLTFNTVEGDEAIFHRRHDDAVCVRHKLGWKRSRSGSLFACSLRCALLLNLLSRCLRAKRIVSSKKFNFVNN
jgi:hypothetical protein